MRSEKKKKKKNLFFYADRINTPFVLTKKPIVKHLLIISLEKPYIPP